MRNRGWSLAAMLIGLALMLAAWGCHGGPVHIK